MHPIDFEEKNVVFGEGQEEYQDLPAYSDGQNNVVTCWKISEADYKKIQKTKTNLRNLQNL